MLGLAQWTVGDLESASRRSSESVASLTAAGHVSDVLGCSIALADIQVTQGRLSDATRTYQAGLDLASACGVLRGTADMHIGLAEVLLERNDLAAALSHLEASTQLGEQAGLPQHMYRWRVASARIRRSEGDRAGALSLLDEVLRAYNTDLSPPVRPVAAVRARAQLVDGDIAAAQRRAAERGLAPDDELSYLHEYEHITLARVLLATYTTDPDSPSTEDVSRLVERLLAAAEAGQRNGSIIEILVVLSHAHQARGDHSAATAALEQALSRAKPEGYLRIFLEELPALSPLLRAASRQGAGRDHAKAVLAATAVRVGREVGGSRQGLVDELSSRELDVLRLLRTDLSGPEIARELLVSLNTLRTHTKNIYMKLGATDRREAVRRAGELGR